MAVTDLDVRDLTSVRRAAGRELTVRGDVVGADRPAGGILGGGLWSLRHSALARKIVVYNLIGLTVLVAGVLALSPGRDALAERRVAVLASEARLAASALDVRGAGEAGFDAGAALAALDLREGTLAWVFDARMDVAALARGDAPAPDGARPELALEPVPELEARAAQAAASTLGAGDTVLRALAEPAAFVVATPLPGGGALVLASDASAIASAVSEGRTRVLWMAALGAAVSVVLALALASTIATPLADLARAADAGRARQSRGRTPERIRIPDLSGRPDEIGRLSGSLRGMVAALHDRIEANEQFAADVAHEIKNPLASLRSAAGTLRVAPREDQRLKLLEVIDHDVQRLDRLVTDIAGASRLDSELVREAEAPFDLYALVGNLGEHLGRQARAKGIEFILDLPEGEMSIRGLEGRLAQVLVNLVSNAMSFCDEGDAIRMWARRRDDRVLVVVEDTGPGIPEGAEAKIFQRFYSQRPSDQFGENSGLGLAISKQIVEAHGGVIWAENIEPTADDPDSAPLGARFVVGLPA
ncbi:MAG: ATP-binding protein [Paracoccaceae bacterium]